MFTGFLQEILFFSPQVWRRKTFTLISTSKLSAFSDMLVHLPQTFQLFGPNGRSQECGKFKTAVKAQVVYV